MNAPAVKHVARRILLVEPHADSREVLSALLEHYGHQVRCVATPELGLISAQVFAPDAVLIAIDYSDPSSYIFCKQLRALPETANSFIVGLSTYNIKDVEHVTDTAGFNEILLKPTDMNKFLEKMSSHKPSLPP